MDFIDNISKDEFDNFVKSNKKAHFLQSYAWGEFSKKNKEVIPHYVGIKNNEALVGASLLLEKKLPFGLSYFYAPRGFVIDYDNEEIIDTFTKEIKIYAKKHNAIFVKIDPDIKLHDINLEGKEIEGSKNNYPLVEHLKKMGYVHKGFNKNFENSSPRYTFRLDLDRDIDAIINGFHPTTKKIIKKGNPYNLKIIKNDESLIQEFYETMRQTAKREGISIYKLEYYLNFYKELHKEGMSDLYVVKADIRALKNSYNENIEKLNKQIDSIKSENKKNEYINQLNKVLKEKKELDEISDNELTLSSIITTKYADKVWTVHGGNHSLLRSLNSNYLIYFEIIKDANKDNYKMIDFFGTTGNPNPDNSVYGIHLFKKRLGGEYQEFIGEFDLVIKPILYFAFTHLIRIRRAIQKAKNKVK